MSTPNPFEAAAIPFAVYVVTSLQTLVNSLDPNPIIAAQQLPGALQVLVGQVEMKFPSLAVSEFGALKTGVSSQLGNILTKLNALQSGGPAPAPAA